MFIRPLLLTLPITLLWTAIADAQTPRFPVGTTAYAQWDAWTPELAEHTQIALHQLRIDGGPILSTAQGVPPVFPIPTSCRTGGTPCYHFQLPQSVLTIGPHQFELRACRADGTTCSDWTSAVAEWEALPPPTPRNLRIVGTSAQQAAVEIPLDNPVLSIPKAIEAFEALATFAVLREPTPSELQHAITTYRGPIPPSRFDVAAHVAALLGRR